MTKVNLAGDADLEALSEIECKSGDNFIVEFFSGRETTVTVVSSRIEGLEQILNDLDDGQPISIDFEWKPDTNGEIHPIATFQFATSKGVLVILNDSGVCEPVRDFLLSRRCIGKGMTCDNFKLQKMFGVVFYFEDIEVSKLIPYGLPLSFQPLVEHLIGESVASFKDKRISCSDWSHRPLSLQQVLYASFDVYAMHLCYFEIQHRFNDFEFKVTPPIARLFASRKPAKPVTSKKIAPISAKKALRAHAYEGDLFLTKDQFYMFAKHPETDNTEFIPREEYTTKWSLFHRLLATHRIREDGTCLDCNLKFASQSDLMAHIWSQHVDEIPWLFFCRPAQSFVRQMLWQIVIAKDAIVHEDGCDSVSCSQCGAKLNGFRGLYTHCRLQHLGDSTPVDVRIDLKKLLFEILCGIHEVDPVTANREVGKCRICRAEFADNDAIIEHCWYEHSEHIIDMWMHRPLCYPEFMYSECFDIGVHAIKNLVGLTMIDGSYACSFCQTGSDDPGELFIHMLHKHSVVFAVSAADIAEYPLKVAQMHPMLQDVIRRAKSKEIQGVLRSRGILDSEFQRCCECSVVFANEQDLWSHIMTNHAVIGFHHT